MCRIRNDDEKPEVRQACMPVIIDQDVRLDKIPLGDEVTASIRSHTPFRSPCIIT